MRKKTWNTLAAGALVAVMASSVITGCQGGQSTATAAAAAAQETHIQAEEAGKADTETTGGRKGSGDVHGTGRWRNRSSVKGYGTRYGGVPGGTGYGCEQAGRRFCYRLCCCITGFQ